MTKPRSAGRGRASARRDIVVVGASAGGIQALVELVTEMPALDAAMFVVLHVPRSAPSSLPAILGRAAGRKVQVAHARHGEPIRHGHLYVAPPDTHLLVHEGRVQLTRGPAENGSRPAIDPLFRSAALAFGPRVIGVILSGARDDGTDGLRIVKARGGLALVQDPAEAMYPTMPQSAIDHVAVDRVAPVRDLAATLGARVGERVAAPARAAAKTTTKTKATTGARKEPARAELETETAELDAAAARALMKSAVPSGVTCPQCHGALFEQGDAVLPRFRCRVGHAYSLESLGADQLKSLDDALWTAYRALREAAAIARRLAKHATEHGRHEAASAWQERALNSDDRASIIERLLARTGVSSVVEEG